MCFETHPRYTTYPTQSIPRQLTMAAGFSESDVNWSQNGFHFADDILKCIFTNEKLCILIRISLNVVPKDLIDNKSALVQVMAWGGGGGGWVLNIIALPDSLTYLPLNKMAAISRSISSDGFPWMKSFVFLSKFHWSLFLRVQLTVIQRWSR